MKRILCLVLFTTVMTFFSACGGTEIASNSENTNTASAPASDPNATVVDRENQAHEAWKTKNGKFFESFLTPGFVYVAATGRNNVEGLVKMISGNPCEVKSYTLSDDQTVELAEGVSLLTSKLTSDASCDGKTLKSPTWVASVYVKEGDQWKGAFHQSVAAFDAKGDAPPPPGKDVIPEDTDQDVTSSLLDLEKKFWEGWANKDVKVFEENTVEKAVDLSFQGRLDRAAMIKDVAENKCEVKSHSLDDVRATKISDNIWVLTYKGVVDATCDGKPAPKVSWGTTIYTKKDDKWMGAFHMSTPGAE